MIPSRARIVVGLAFWAGAGCSTATPGEPAPQVSSGELAVEHQTETEVVATYRAADAVIVMRGVQEGHLFTSFIEIDGSRVRVTVDETSGAFEFDGDALALDDAHKATLAAAAEALGVALVPAESERRHEGLLQSMVAYLSEAPTGHVLPTRSAVVDAARARKYNAYPGANGTLNDSDHCRDYHGSETICWEDDYPGGQTNHNGDDPYGWCQDGVKNGHCFGGAYNCIGRCGVGCGKWYAPSNWTLDCKEHDVCSYWNNASGGSDDPNCGDEFDEAADDYASATFWGCAGWSKNPLGC